MNDKRETASDTDLNRLFEQMRREDAVQAPDFPDVAMLAGREPVVAGREAYGVMPKLAAAAAVAAVAVFLMRGPAPQDAAVLYADLMSANSIATDTLLSVSPGTLPGMLSLPDVYEMDLATGTEQGMN
jgi:hypothetical protein